MPTISISRNEAHLLHKSDLKIATQARHLDRINLGILAFEGVAPCGREARSLLSVHTMTGAWNGICCSWGDGSYLLELDDGTAVASGGDFAGSEKTCFSAPLPAPAPVPTKQPTTTTGPPAPSPTAYPTVAPMSCDEAGC